MKLTPALADAWQLRLSAAIEAQDKGRAEILNNHHRHVGQNAADTPEARCAVTTVRILRDYRCSTAAKRHTAIAKLTVMVHEPRWRNAS